MPLITLDHIAHAYGHLPLLDDASLQVEAGERVAIIGPNGAGKSTLFNLISGRFHASTGDILVNGKVVARGEIVTIDDIVLIPRRAGAQREPVRRLLAHLLEHQVHHRGQIHAMLAGTRVRPPQLDEFFSANEAHLRAAELAELGWSEALVWGPP